MELQLIQNTRASSRKLVRELGFLRPGAAICDIPFAQCHTLIELGERGTLTMGELADALKVDKSAISRTVNQMVEEKLVAIKPDKQDPRKRPVILTTFGKERLERLHEKINQDVAQAMSLLSVEERYRVVEGLTLYANAIAKSNKQKGFQIRRITKTDNPAIADLLRKVITEFGANKEGFAFVDPEIDDMHGTYSSRRSVYFILEKDGKVVGGAGLGQLKDADKETCELRKMYFLPEVRGFGLGKKLLELCLEEATKFGYRKVYIESLDRMHQAQSLYKSFGFQPLAKPMGNTGHFNCNSWYVKET